MKRNNVAFATIIVGLIGVAAASTGCEVIAEIDRGKLVSFDGGTDDATTTDGSTDGTLTDVGSDVADSSVADTGEDTSSAGDAADAGDSGSDTGPTCDAGTATCTVPTTCPATSTACIVRTCAGGCCGTQNAASATACSDNAGKLCDGNGACVACLQASDCAAQTTVCKVSTCSGAHACGTTNVAKGTACTDNGGVVCDGNGACVATHCADGIMDADETDVDCGGSCGATCKDTGPQQKCKVGGDCISHVCSGAPLMCQPPTCTDGQKNGNETDVDCGGTQCDGQGKTCGTTKACGGDVDCTSGYCPTGTCQLAPNGHACTANGQCALGNCIGNICCDGPCSGTCQACTIARTGVATGTCASIIAGQVAPAGQCTASPPCGNDGNCAAGGACEQANASTVCAPAACANGVLTTVSMCSGSGACNSGSSAACAGGFVCADATSCKTACASDGDCQSNATFCQNPGPSGTCAAKGGSGALCGGNNQCTSSLCGTAGTGTHCCAPATSCSGGACGTTDCTNTGVCAYPGNAVVPPGIQTPGDCQKLVCNGSGGTTSMDDPTDLPVSSSACLINPACTGVPLTPSFTPAPTGTTCTATDPLAHVCGDTSSPLLAGTCVECNVNADCPVAKPTCTPATGLCN